MKLWLPLMLPLPAIRQNMQIVRSRKTTRISQWRNNDDLDHFSIEELYCDFVIWLNITSKTKKSVVVIVVVDVRERSALKEKVRAKSSKLLDTKLTQTMANKKLICIVGSTWSSYKLKNLAISCFVSYICFWPLYCLRKDIKSYYFSPQSPTVEVVYVACRLIEQGLLLCS